MTYRWYGEEPAFRAALEGPARRRYGARLSVKFEEDRTSVGHASTPGALVFSVDGIDVRGRERPVPVEVKFSATSAITRAAGIRPEEFPSVYADHWEVSPHRHTDRALCLYFPFDPPHLRWRVDDGLERLLDMAAEHLYFEDYWRRHVEWLGTEAPHGLPGSARTAFGQVRV